MESVLIISGAMTALLDRLTKLELIYRASNKSDGRIKLAGLTGGYIGANHATRSGERVPVISV